MTGVFSKSPKLRMKSVALAVLLSAGLASGADAASNAELAALLDKLNRRVDKLEQDNARLQRELAASRAAPTAVAAAPAPALEQRVQVLEQQQAQLHKSLDADTISETEPALSARLKAVETQAAELAGPVAKLKALDGISGGLSLSMVAQRSFGVTPTDKQLGYRADATVSLPLESIGDVDQSLFAQVRLGQGSGLNGLTSFSNPNAIGFQLGGGLRADDSVALLAQAWYQADIALPWGGFKPQSKQKLEITLGKMDPFVFFDQNAVAGDETRQFLNSVFVHNPLLDAGGDIGVDANGFTPGLRVSLLDTSDKLESWRLSFGVFGAGEKGASYQRSLGGPVVMLQAETARRFFGGLLGNYRVYAWSNAQGTHFDPAQTEPQRHVGWGVSVDQRVGDGLTLFGRFGNQAKGNVAFDRALTVGAEANGSYWSRGGDSLGLGLGWLRTSAAYREFQAASVARPGAEQVAELYYRFRVGKQFELSPSLQWLNSPGGDADARSQRVVGLRSQFTF
jgi:high affinity Mn2+ porin